MDGKIKKVYNKARSTGQTKKQENQQGIHQKTSKRACRVLKKCKKRKKKLWTEETTIILHQNEGKRVEKERNSKSSVKHDVVMLLCACGTGSLLVIDDVTAAKSRG